MKRKYFASFLKLCAVVAGTAVISTQAFAYKESCEGRLFAELEGSGYQIDLMNHLVTTDEFPSQSGARGLAVIDLHFCLTNLWLQNDAIQNMSQSDAQAAAKNACPNVSGMSPLAIDIENRLKELACSKTWRSLTNIFGFYGQLKVETRGEKGCGIDDERELTKTIASFSITPSMCAPMRN